MERPKKLYHGTSVDAGLQILESGEFDCSDTVWICSYGDRLYLHGSLKDEDNCDYYNIRYAIESAQITAASTDQRCDGVIIFEFEIPEKYDHDELTEDCSCENAYNAFEINCEDLNELIKNGEIKVKARLYKDAYTHYLTPFYLRCLVDNTYYEFKDKKLHEVTKLIAKSDCACDIPYGIIDEWCEDFTEIELEPDSAKAVDINMLKKEVQNDTK